LVQAKTEGEWDEILLGYLCHLFFAYVEELINAGLESGWPAGEIRIKIEKALHGAIEEAFSEKHYRRADPFWLPGFRFSATNHVYASEEWREIQAKLSEIAEWEAEGSDHQDNARTVPGRKRGPKPDFKNKTRTAEIVERVAAGGNWADKLDEICDALDTAEIPYPKTWPKRELRMKSWKDGAEMEPTVAKKAIEDRLKAAASQRKKATPETLS
jgi:hypothetical protein